MQIAIAEPEKSQRPTIDALSQADRRLLLGDNRCLPRSKRLTALRVALIFLRVGAEQGIPISVQTLTKIAQSLELLEVPA
jgi:hypothetical protein